MTSLVFIDTETDGLHPGRRAWEIGMIRRDDAGQRECRMFLPLDLKFSDPAALKIGGFWERHPMGRKLAGKQPAPSNDPMLCEVPTPTPCEPVTSAHEAAKKVMEWTFDAQVLERLLRSEGYLPSWHYRLIDVEALTSGYAGKLVGGLAKRTDAPTPYALNPPTHTLADCLTMPPAIQQRIEQALKEIRDDH